MEQAIVIDERFRSAVPEVNELEKRVKDFDVFVSEFIFPLRQRIIELIEEGKKVSDDLLTDFGIYFSPQDDCHQAGGSLGGFVINKFILGYGYLSIDSIEKYRFDDARLESRGEPEERFKKFMSPLDESTEKVFNSAISNILGDDYKALYLFAFYNNPMFHTLEKSGNWDYVDLVYNDFKPAESDRDAVDKILRQLNWQIVNPWAIEKKEFRCVSSLMKSNKTTRFIKWRIPETPPPEFEPGSYNLVHLNSDFASSGTEPYGFRVALDSIKEGGLLVMPSDMVKGIMQLSGSIRPALVSEHILYNILESTTLK